MKNRRFSEYHAGESSFLVPLPRKSFYHIFMASFSGTNVKSPHFRPIRNGDYTDSLTQNRRGNSSRRKAPTGFIFAAGNDVPAGRNDRQTNFGLFVRYGFCEFDQQKGQDSPPQRHHEIYCPAIEARFSRCGLALVQEKYA